MGDLAPLTGSGPAALSVAGFGDGLLTLWLVRVVLVMTVEAESWLTWLVSDSTEWEKPGCLMSAAVAEVWWRGGGGRGMDMCAARGWWCCC